MGKFKPDKVYDRALDAIVLGLALMVLGIVWGVLRGIAALV